LGKTKNAWFATFVDDTAAMELVWFQGVKWIKETLKSMRFM
jgi:ATP-dependent DNA helicase RecG